MTKPELITAISEASSLSKKDTETFLNAFINVVGAELSKGEKIQLIGFGTFETLKRPERTGINPKTKEKLVVPSHNSPRFKPGKALKDAVNS